jgi:hypothetical protein
MDDSCLHHTMRTALVKKQKAARRLLFTEAPGGRKSNA